MGRLEEEMVLGHRCRVLSVHAGDLLQVLVRWDFYFDYHL